MKVYVVEKYWSYEGCPNGFDSVCETSTIEGIFDSEDKAIAYIQNEIRKMIDKSLAILAAREVVDINRCRGENCDICIACRHIPTTLNKVPDASTIKKNQGIAYLQDHLDKDAYHYTSYEVK